MNINIYLAGKVSGLSTNQVTEKFAAAAKAVKAINPKFKPVCPVTAVNDPNASWDKAMAICIPVLKKCQGIYIQKDWASSPGTKIEIIIAFAEFKRFLYEDPTQSKDVNRFALGL